MRRRLATLAAALCGGCKLLAIWLLTCGLAWPASRRQTAMFCPCLTLCTLAPSLLPQVPAGRC